jgi:hypothetical protein
MTSEEKEDLEAQLMVHIEELKLLIKGSQEAQELLDELMFEEFGYD